MARYRIQPSSLSGTLEIPSSKSHTLRSIFFGLMGDGKTVVHKPLESPDAIAMIDAIRQFGAEVTMETGKIEIDGVAGQLKPAENVIQCGNSGIVLRFIGALAALSSTYTIITGDHSIRHNRPVKPLLDGLSDLGVFATSSRLDDFAPIIIRGPIRSDEATLTGEDSQPVSGLLIAAAFANQATTINVKNAGEKPWIDLTLSWLDRLGLTYENRFYEKYILKGNGSYKGFEYTVPGDFSSAAFPIPAALVTNSEVTLTNIDMSDVQGDKKLIFALQDMGAIFEIDEANKTLTVKKDSKLQGTTLDINDYVDAITTLAVLGCFASGETHLTNAAIARTKECDRIHSIATELKKMGANIEETEDGLIIKKSPLTGTTLDTHRDQRMVMSLSVAALGAAGESIINDITWAQKTYPMFLEHFQSLGAQMEQINS